MFSTVICRLCLNTDRRTYFINHTILQETWERLTNSAFDRNDGRPLLVCYICCVQLKNSHELRKRALRAEELFTKYLTNNNFVDSKKLMALIVSNTYNNDYNYAIEEQHSLDCGQKVPERVEEVKKEIEDDEVINVKEEGGKMFFNLDEAVPVQEEDLVVDTISIKKEIEDAKEEINSESDMHDTVTETQADYEDPLTKRSFEEIVMLKKSEVSNVLERIYTGVTAKKCKTEDLHQSAEHNVVDEAIMERKSLNKIFICQPKELSVTFDEKISLDVFYSILFLLMLAPTPLALILPMSQ
ncbi:hypothetical protein K1T71_015063 [Dendrolimus kikuchii]|nr:hypothetical protein K1T71_015063 [Dendrolimus kikuchii]